MFDYATDQRVPFKLFALKLQNPSYRLGVQFNSVYPHLPCHPKSRLIYNLSAHRPPFTHNILRRVALNKSHFPSNCKFSMSELRLSVHDLTSFEISTHPHNYYFLTASQPQHSTQYLSV